MRKADRIGGWRLAIMAGCCVIAMVSIFGCGEDTSPPAAAPATVDEALQAESIQMWVDTIYSGSNVANIENMCGQSSVISDADSYKWLYFPEVDLTFKVNKERDVVEQISRGKVKE